MAAFSYVICFIACFSVVSCKNERTESIKIAYNVPMTGDLSFYGECIMDGFDFAMEELSDSLKKNNLIIESDYQDNACNARDAVSAFNRQKISQFDIYVSGVNNPTMAIMDLVKATNKPHFIYSFLPFEILENDNVYRPYLDLEFEGKCMIKYIAKQQPKKIAFVYQNILSTNSQFEKIIKPYVKEKNINIVVDECYDVSTTDFKNIVTKIKKASPDLIIVYGFKNHLIEIIKGFNFNGIKKDGNIVCSFDFLDIQPILSDELLDGIVTNVPQYIVNNIDMVQKWRSRFEKKYNREPVFIDAYAYDMAYTLYYTFITQKHNPNMSFDESIRSVRFDGLTGSISYHDNGQLSYNVQPCIYKNGEYQFIVF